MAEVPSGLERGRRHTFGGPAQSLLEPAQLQCHQRSHCHKLESLNPKPEEMAGSFVSSDRLHLITVRSRSSSLALSTLADISSANHHEDI